MWKCKAGCKITKVVVTEYYVSSTDHYFRIDEEAANKDNLPLAIHTDSPEYVSDEGFTKTECPSCRREVEWGD